MGGGSNCMELPEPDFYSLKVYLNSKGIRIERLRRTKQCMQLAWGTRRVFK